MSLSARSLAPLIALVTLAACSGGGDSTPTTPNTPSPPTAVASVSVTLGSPQLVVGGNAVATAETRSSTGASLTGRALSWTSSNPSVASVSSTGAITALTPGTTSIVATSEGQSGSATLTVVAVPVAVVTVTLAQSSITVGTATTASATLRSASNDVLTGRAILWTSSNPAVATINMSGAITALTPGTTTITAASDGQSGAILLTVTPVPVASVVVTLAQTTIIVGANTSATATLRGAGNELLTGRSVSWTTSNPAVASVNASGLVTALTTGMTSITATSEGRSGSATITVAGAPVFTVVVSGPGTLSAGQAASFSAVLRDVAGALLTDRPVSWSSSNSAVATVTGAGVVTALSPGTTEISAASEGRIGSIVLTVRSSIASVTLIGDTRVKVGDQYSYTAAIRLQDGTVVQRAITWSVADPTRASMIPSGVLTPLQSGPIRVQATIDGELWDITVDAYDWVRLAGTSSVFHYLPADNRITNKFGSSEYAELIFSCNNTSGQFFSWVSFDRFVTANGNVALSFDGNTPFSQTWSEISSFDALFKPGSNAVVKAFAQQVASARIFGFAFTEFQGSAKAMLFRVAGLSTRLNELFALCPGSAIVQPVTAQSAASAFAEAQGVIAAFHNGDGQLDALRESRRQQGASFTGSATAELRRVQRGATTETPARKR